MTDYINRMVRKDGKCRITIYKDEYPENPRVLTDEPLHCHDFSRSYSIMVTREKSNAERFSSMRSLLGWMLREYGDERKVIDALIENGKHMTDGKALMSDALVYDRSEKAWLLMCYDVQHVTGWYVYDRYYWRRDELSLLDIVDSLGDCSIDHLVASCMTDRVKMASYRFGYDGVVSFHEGITCKSAGIAWLDKEEFQEYAGNGDDYWKGKSLRDIEFLLGEIEAWSEGDVYGYIVEDRDDVEVHERHSSGEEKDYVRVDWTETDTCWGFYGSHDMNWFFGVAGLNVSDFTEETA